MLVFANDSLLQLLEVGADPTSEAIATTMTPSIRGIAERVTKLTTSDLSEAALSTRERELRTTFEQYLSSDQWLTNFRGRDVLRAFVNKHVRGVKYETFRDLILARMKDAGFRPPGMAAVLTAIDEDPFP